MAFVEVWKKLQRKGGQKWFLNINAWPCGLQPAVLVDVEAVGRPDGGDPVDGRRVLGLVRGGHVKSGHVVRVGVVGDLRDLLDPVMLLILLILVFLLSLYWGIDFKKITFVNAVVF